MRVLKFMVLHVAVDTAFVYLIVKIVLAWMSGNVIIAKLMPLTVLIVLIAIAFYNVQFQGLIRSIADVAVGFFMFILYQYSAETSYDILQSNVWFIVVVRGLIGLALGLGAFTIFRKIICAYLKAAQIYCLSQERNISILGSLAGAALRFKFTVSIPVFNKIIHSIFHDLFEALTGNKSTSGTLQNSAIEGTPEDQAESVEMSNPILNNPIITRLQQTPVIRASKSLLKIYVSYLDECVMAYCYRYPDKGLFKGSLEAIQIALAKAVSIIGQIAILVFVNVILRILVIVAYVIVVIKFVHFQFVYLIVSLIMARCAIFILQDAICEPLLMTGILKKFCSYELTEEDKQTFSAEKLRELIPSFSKMDKFKDKDSQDSAESSGGAL